MTKNHTEEVVFLVGGNPLPNYVAARTLRAQRGIERVHLLYTNEVEEVKDNLLVCLVKKDGFQSREPTFIKDAGDAEAIQDACHDIAPGSHLHYTGGTNSMAVHVHAAWKEKGGTPGQASYLFGKDDRLITDAGEIIEIDNIQLDLDTLATLHGLEEYTPRDVRKGGPDLPGDAEEIAKHVSEAPELADKLYLAIPSKESDFKKQAFCSEAAGLCLSEHLIPGEGWGSSQIKVWRKFRRGECLEEWIYQKFKETKLVDDNYLYAGIRPKIRGREFELDVVAIRGHHLYVASCTIEHEQKVCKSKLFEVSMRARQLGGDLARSALICLADRDKEGNNVVDELQKDVRSLSESSRVPQVFGLKSVREWAGFHGSTPNLTTLKDWLTDKE